MTVFSKLKLPTLIYEAESPVNGKIQVYETEKTRKLVVAGVTQSVNHTSPLAQRMCWGKIVSVIEEALGTPNRVLLLGLGGATVPWLLTHKFPSVSIVSVEFDPMIVEATRKYFDLDKIPNHRVIVDDALRVVTLPEEFGLSPNEFDCVIVDTFVGEIYPELGNSGTFFAGVKKFLAPGGLAIFNRIYLKHHQADVNNFIENVSDNFREVKSLVVAGKTNSDNVIIFGYA